MLTVRMACARAWPRPIPTVAAAVLFAVALRAAMLALPALTSVLHVGRLPLANPWAHWDAVYYVRLATNGYGPYVHGPDHTGLAFLPLYPLLLALPIHLGLPAYAVSMGLATLCAVIAFAALAVLVARDFGTDVAARTVTLVAATPAALFLGLGYSESLYFALSLCGFVALRRARWTVAALLFALAAVTRPTGVLLALPYLVEWLYRYRRAPRAGLRHLAPVGLLPLALGLVALYDAGLGASPLAYLQVEHTAWHQSWAWPWVTITRQISALGTLGVAGSSLLPVGLLNLAAAVLAVPLLALAVCRLPRSYAVYALAVYVMVTSVSSGAPYYGRDVAHPFMLPLISTHRYLLIAFPLAISAALLVKRRSLFVATTSTLLLLQLNLGLLFVNRLWAG
jgi:Gpi18-like mannosyltransferase